MFRRRSNSRAGRTDRLHLGLQWYRAAMNDSPIDTPADDPRTDEARTDESGTPDRHEPGFTSPSADRAPTAEEERVADQVAADVDLDRVAEHYEDAMETGAHVRGEGQIEPDPT
jgi:hypothetical protein